MVKFLRRGEKVEISNFIGFVYLKNPNFWRAELKTRSHFSPKLFTALHCQDRKLLCQFLAQAIDLLDKLNSLNLKFLTSHLIEEILPFFDRLNWKPRFRFC